MLFDLRCCGFDRVMANSRVFFSDLKSDKCSSVVEARLLWFRYGETINVKPGGELVWVDMLMVDVNVSSFFPDFDSSFSVTHIYISMTYISNFSELRPYYISIYRIEMAIADDTAAGIFVWFDGMMKKLHNLRASEAVQMLAEDGVNSEDSRRLGYLHSLQIWKESQYTFQVRITAYNLTGNHKILIFSIADELGRVRDDDVGDNVSIMCNMEVTRMMMTTCLMASQLLLGLHLEGPLVMDQMGLYGTARKNPDVSSSKVVKKARVA
ncbi:hypothetical protein HID58_066871 [Brassica napus]|uniref:Uncharacterized protein n=1 Tax=Brassica napus TaxID=3708 RepID=A0ABQ7ZGX2_BRANA|nr:hypothetical protein HID58_066871 [Brassica napus]